ncbi:hypothetical protein DY000_02002640 [Brassica cretica]|uniref:Uncharacterized protein n=1 Tax=Brassica cretica TaxID=69181 RepID=A0ABQ7CIR2_BRACR|nr:hypothetical protein DY000_02002640 [Brassica cretica]
METSSWFSLFHARLVQMVRMLWKKVSARQYGVLTTRARRKADEEEKSRALRAGISRNIEQSHFMSVELGGQGGVHRKVDHHISH